MIKHLFKGTFVLALCIGITLTAATAQAVSLITNGSFELATIVPDGDTLEAGSTAITGWTVTSGDIDYIGNYWTASDGVRSLDMNGRTSGNISQSFSTIIGKEYEVRFDMAGNPDSGPTIKSLRASVDSIFFDFTFDNTGWTRTSMGWEEKSFLFTAIAPETTLSFISLTADCCWGPALDNVEVARISNPEPASLLLLGSGLVGLAARRKRRQGS